MNIAQIINFVKSYLILGVVAAAVLTALFFISYLFLYKKLLKGRKRLKVQTVLLFLVSVCYLEAVSGSVYLRFSGYSGTAVLQPFASYVQAWNTWSAAGWRNILLNILLFVPFGFLLPLWGRFFQKLWRTVLCGFFFSLAVELTQLFTSRGIFEMDDLIGNTLGVTIGFGLGMLFLAIVKKEKPSAKKTIGCLAPLLVTCLAFFSIFAAYSLQELGNLPAMYSARMDMESIALSSETPFSEEAGSAKIYRVAVASQQDTEKLAQSLFTAAGTTLDETNTILYDETVYYYGENDSVILTVNYLGSTYRYTDFSKYRDDSKPLAGADESAIRGALRKLNAEPPDGCVFSDIGEGSYAFSTDMAAAGDAVINGSLSCTYYADGTVKDVSNEILALEPYSDCDIISEAEAYAKLEAGWFSPPYYAADIFAIAVKSVELNYALDSKGFYLPVYRFACVYGNGSGENQADIEIPAMR